MAKSYANGLPNIVVLGAGGAGAKVVNALSKTLNPAAYNLVLVDARPYYVHWPAMIRMVVTSAGKLEDTALIPLDKNFVNGNGTLVVGKATSIVPSKDGSGGEVILASGEKLPYAILVLATGSVYEGPLLLPETKEETVRWANEWRDRFDKSHSVVLVGGGAIGVEMAGEIKDSWPNKKVTIVQGDTSLLNATYPARFRSGVVRGLEKRGVEFVFDDYIDALPAPGSASVTTRKGKVLQADLVVPTRGGRPNTEIIKLSLPGAVDANGRVKVTRTLQLPGYTTIFAAGDITDILEQKQVAKYPAQATLIASNITSLLAGQSPAKEYKKQPEMILLTNGTGGGAAYVGMLWGIILGDWFARMMKSKELLVGMVRGSLGY
ncbi:FAD/NAD-P-binding domain-containing protein [Calocera viscosa TUFC12733]|uniref:FAD/NAD-P-binding domain-containing protein n=1 Tax=Calocera viscosa (strain TUFC12733) TaxID=1330018 RepID=A0A167Q912_CALVF|nr:FAD/NAD-P-binding domain-containing protein [Calocera viscosa TUFC12733]